MDIGAWWAAVQRVAKSGTQMSMYRKNLNGSGEFALAPFSLLANAICRKIDDSMTSTYKLSQQHRYQKIVAR